MPEARFKTARACRRWILSPMRPPFCNSGWLGTSLRPGINASKRSVLGQDVAARANSGQIWIAREQGDSGARPSVAGTACDRPEGAAACGRSMFCCRCRMFTYSA